MLFCIFAKIKFNMKTQTAFRIDKTLLAMVKEKAKRSNRSLNNYVENLLYKDVGNVPNETTIEALKEAHSSKELETINDLNCWLDKI